MLDSNKDFTATTLSHYKAEDGSVFKSKDAAKDHKAMLRGELVLCENCLGLGFVNTLTSNTTKMIVCPNCSGRGYVLP